MTFKNIYSGKKVLITGHTGFKGSWLSIWLKLLGAKVIGLSLDPPTNPNNFTITNIASSINDLRIDIRERDALAKIILDEHPDFIFHLAAQGIVRKSYKDPYETWSTNLIGTINLLEAIRGLRKSCTVVLITSDKCYKNVEWIWGYRENDLLGGKDPYSASKGAVEMAFSSYIDSFFSNDDSVIRLATARAGNVIGGGDWADDRIIPDCVRAWTSSSIPEIRNPNATRPWQHVLEPLSGYLCLGSMLASDHSLHGESFNFGPRPQNNHTVRDLVIEMSKHWNMVKWNDSSDVDRGPHEAGLLRLNCDKALTKLGWEPVLGFSDTVRITSEWYRNYYSENSNMQEETSKQILEYEKKAKYLNISWAE